MSDIVNIKSEFFKQLRTVVPAVLGMSVVLGIFNAPEWTFAVIWPKVVASLSMALLGCLFGLAALLIGLFITNARQSVMAGWFAGLMIGFAGIAFMLWFYAQPIT
jgi:hypothetical protein